MVESGPAVMLPGNPVMIANERSVRPCGCCVWVGVRMDNQETATGATPCSPAHLPMLEMFNELLIQSLPTSSPELLVQVCDRFLGEADAMFHAGPA